MPAVYASTSPAWFAHLAQLRPLPERIAFWRPTYTVPVNIAVGEPWFFKEWGAPVVLGYGRFVAHEGTTPRQLWDMYGEAAGSATAEELLEAISTARRRGGGATLDTGIGNVILSNFTAFAEPLSLTDLELPNLPVPFRYVPDGNRLLGFAEERNVPLEYREPEPAVRREIQLEVFARNAGHVAFVRNLYGGRCQVTGEPVFDGIAGDLTQIHHIEFLCQGGADDPSNMMALSPNWHSIAHAQGTRFDWTTLEFVVGERRVELALNRHLRPR